MKTRWLLPLAGAWFSLMMDSPAQSAAPAPLPAESRQFDFWLGEWEVTTPEGKPAGTNKVELIAGAAGLLESWTGASGYTGKSLNAYDAATKQWRQCWVGRDGGVLDLRGGLVNGSMVLAGEHDADGRQRRERITWTPKADGTVRQHWEQSTDAGKTWQTVFDGLYRRKK